MTITFRCQSLIIPVCMYVHICAQHDGQDTACLAGPSMAAEICFMVTFTLIAGSQEVDSSYTFLSNIICGAILRNSFNHILYFTSLLHFMLLLPAFGNILYSLFTYHYMLLCFSITPHKFTSGIKLPISQFLPTIGFCLISHNCFHGL